MGNRISGIVITAIILFIVDFYVYQAFKTSFSPKRRKAVLYGYWIVTGITLFSVFLGIFLSIGRTLRTVIFVWFFVNYFSKIFTLPFLLIDDLRRLAKKCYRYFRKNEPVTEVVQVQTVSTDTALSRSQFLMRAGLTAAAIPFTALNAGIISGAYDYEIRRQRLVLPNLPKSFEGLKLAQISDVHSGSFYNKTAVQGGIDMLNAEKPDMVFFTGDLVNDQSSEMNDYMSIFEKVKAPMGVYSVLGNHDYGDYIQWPSIEAKKKNLDKLKTIHKNLGWDLLMNENRILEQSGDKLAILGIENWGAMARFPKHGKMEEAVKGTDEAAVKLLLSHDPSHWRAEVLPKYKDIDAMFSGHTHGMQFGLRIGDFQWSPVQYVYKEWAGLYKEQQQQLYVNVGYGFLGYPGRVGIYPEITIFELTRG